jgi:hypothetical protein
MKHYTVSEVTQLLIKAEIDYNSWMVKGVEHLVHDLNNGERQLVVNADNTLSLDGHVVKCRIYHAQKELIETSLTTIKGEIVHRNYPCTGKITIKEDPIKGMQREINEELGFKKSEYLLIPKGTTYEESLPGYYKGIPGKMVVHNFIVHLPEKLYKSEYILTEQDRTFTFTWEPIGRY